MDNVIFKHMHNSFHSNDLICKNQSGFLPDHSTVFQLIDIYHQICQNIDAKQHTCMIFCNIRKHLTVFGIEIWFSNYPERYSRGSFTLD